MGVLRGNWRPEKMEKGPSAELMGPKGAEKRLVDLSIWMSKEREGPDA